MIDQLSALPQCILFTNDSPRPDIRSAIADLVAVTSTALFNT